MPEKITGRILASLLVLALIFSTIPVQAHEDDYIVGLSAFRDGLYEISAPSLEEYLKGETEERKADYSHYLLYQMYLQSEDYRKSVAHLEKIKDATDRRFDNERMATDRMFLLTKTSCDKAADYLKQSKDERVINFYLDSECRPDKAAAQHILENVRSPESKLKLVSKFSDDKEFTASVFDTLKLSELDDNSKKYFALYFYKNGDMDRFAKIREVYEDADVVGLELDSLWQKGDRDGFIAGFTKYKEKYELAGANACRAIDVYKKKNVQFDCNLVNECMQGYSVQFVQVKGACLVKEGNKEKVTEFVDSLKPSIFPGMCGYGEYVFHNGLYTGKSQSKFYQCEERYKIADILISKKDYQSVVNMFFKKGEDKDKYYTAVALRALGKTKAADSIAAGIKDEALKAKYRGVAG